MKKTGIFFGGASVFFSLPLPSPCPATPFCRTSACFLGIENIRLPQDGRSPFVFFPSFPLGASEPSPSLAESTSAEGWKFQ